MRSAESSGIFQFIFESVFFEKEKKKGEFFPETFVCQILSFSWNIYFTSRGRYEITYPWIKEKGVILKVTQESEGSVLFE